MNSARKLQSEGAVCAAAVDTATDPRAPKLAHTAEPEDIQSKTGLAYLHSSHCLGSGDIMVSAMGETCLPDHVDAPRRPWPYIQGYEQIAI